MLKNLSKTVIYNKSIISRFPCQSIRALAVAAPKSSGEKTTEWDQAKPYSAIPGPNFFQMIKWFVPGGKYAGMQTKDALDGMRKEFGNLMNFKGILRKRDIVILSSPEDFETTFRTETLWPIRNGMDTFVHYRENVRPDIFKGVGGLVTENGKGWHDFRTVVNPAMLQPRTTKVYIPRVDEIAKEFIQIIKETRDGNLETPANFSEFVNRWSLESISCIALDTRLKVMNEATQDASTKDVIKAVREFSELTYKVEILPSLWRYYQTRNFKKLMAAADFLTNIIMRYVEEAMDRLEQNPTQDENNQGVLEKLMKINKHTAKIMAFDMLLAGIDTTASATVGILYCLASNPEKQQKLREEIMKALPTKDTPLSAENMSSLPYLRAVIKESLRSYPIAIGTMREAGQDLVIQGYKIPKGTNLMISNAVLSFDEAHFPRSKEFLPERWIRGNTEGCPSARDTNPFVYLPFGFGARSCVGRRFAELEMEVLVARMVREFKMEWHHAPIKFKSALQEVPDGDVKIKLIDIN